ncbi:MAG: glycosyltransferase [Paenibacillus dendritiformis]|uniref:glycosyltransferase family protein n=1 Tax=uncultured Paenibacillus sp. TaxID=227322 RepID=UPI0025DE4598|nr:glycosyltransferase [uncultured Paenibacillus sp.]MDU5141608.1 glycosyltransferase [Paenibacillus dendritiformis]
MDINYYNNKMNIINKKRREIFSEMNIEVQETNDNTFKVFNTLKELKIACIMDEFTYNSFEPECEIFQVSPDTWKEQFQNIQPDMFFFESAWKGIDGLWNSKINFLSDELLGIFDYCRGNNIPIIFWNKEDPVHFNTFMAAAKYADIVFTTDIDCIARYKKVLKHDRVFLMPFAAQPKHHNPVEWLKREDKICFAGAYYKRYTERNKDLDVFLETLSNIREIDIFDRNYYSKDPNYSFPFSYKRFIRGYLPSKEIYKAYKGYRFNLNLNSVKQSQSMCARRVFELLASNTVILSNYSRGIRNLFGDLVICTDDRERLIDEVNKLFDNRYYSKFRLLGLRKVLREHTYHQRLLYIVDKIANFSVNLENDRVAIFTKCQAHEEIQNVLKQFERQSFQNKKLFIITKLRNLEIETEAVSILNEINISEMNTIKTEYPYFAFFSPQDYYGSHYLEDFVLALKYTDLNILGKGAFYYCENRMVKLSREGLSYHELEEFAFRRAFIRSQTYTDEQLIEIVGNIENGTIRARGLSIDEFNYCMHFIGDKCDEVDDLVVTDTGINMDQLYEVVEEIESNLDNLGDNTSKWLGSTHLSKTNVLLISNHYPSYSNLYSYTFIHTRLMGYKKNGLIVDVFKYNKGETEYSEFYGIDITAGNSEYLNCLLLDREYCTVLIHYLTEDLWRVIKNSIKGKKVIIWVHGAEIQAFWRRAHNFNTTRSIESAKTQSEEILKFWRQIFELALFDSNYSLHFVFVSAFLMETVFEDIGIRLPEKKYSIIHNYINEKVFVAKEKSADQRKKILSIRPYSNHNYANDLMVKAILELVKEPFFFDLEFMIVGRGELFKKTTKPLRKYSNISLVEKFLRQSEIANLHKDFGVFLVPTRMDTQGVSRDEAMCSGLVPITNKVAAVPEFLNTQCGIIVDAEDYRGLANAIKKLYYDPDLFNVLSKNSANRVRLQSGEEQTIKREMSLISK